MISNYSLSGAENETRTRDPDLGKVVLYQLSYFRSSRAENETRTRDPDLGKVVLYQLSYFRLRIAVQKYNFFLTRKYFLKKLFVQQFFNLIQLHQSLNRSQCINVDVQNVVFNLQQKRVVELNETQLHIVDLLALFDSLVEVVV